MESLKSIYWNQGLFLKPQHFQHLGQHTLASADAYSSVKTGVKYGLSRLDIDQDALKNGMLVINKLETVLADGTLLFFPGNCNLVPVRIDKDLMGSSGHLDVSIGVVPIVADQINLSDDKGNIARFSLNEDVSQADLFDPQESAQLSTVNIDCKILFGEQSKQGEQIACEKIAELTLTGDEIKLDDKFIGNCLTLQSSAVLQNYIKVLKQSLIARFDQLESFSSLNSGNVGDNTSANIATLMAIKVVAEFIPVFAHLEEVKHIHPHHAYLVLRQLIAQLSVFSKTVSVLGEVADVDRSLLSYNQQNLSECFYRAVILANQLLDELTVDPELIVELAAQGESKFVAALSHEFTDSKNMVYIRLRTKEDLESKVDSISQYTKVGADGQVDIYLKRALPGIELKYLPRKPMGVASMPNSFYFSMDRRSFEWQKVVESGRLGFIWNEAPSDLAVELIAVKG